MLGFEYFGSNWFGLEHRGHRNGRSAPYEVPGPSLRFLRLQPGAKIQQGSHPAEKALADVPTWPQLCHAKP